MRRGERVREVGPEVLGVLESDREAEQPVRDPQLGLDLGIDEPVREPGSLTVRPEIAHVETRLIFGQERRPALEPLYD